MLLSTLRIRAACGESASCTFSDPTMSQAEAFAGALVAWLRPWDSWSLTTIEDPPARGDLDRAIEIAAGDEPAVTRAAARTAAVGR
jgi:hypothetical protein